MSVYFTESEENKSKTRNLFLRRLATAIPATGMIRNREVKPSNGKREFVARDQVSSLLVVYCSLFLRINK